VRQVRKLFASQAGVAMPLAMGMLLVVTLMAGGVAATSMQALDHSTTDRNAKRALAAAEAGLHVANVRLNNTVLTSTECLSGVPTATECPQYTEGDVGNGAVYRYWVSQQLAAGETCGSVPTQTQSGTERCITSAGIVNGVQRRVQTRVLDLQANAPLLPVPGVVGLDFLGFKNNTAVNGHIGGNGIIKWDNQLTVQGIDLGPTASTSGSPPTYTQDPPSPVTFEDPFTLPPAPVGLSATDNKNSWITNGGGVTYVAATRSLTLSNATLTLTQSGDYNFCQLVVGNGSTIKLAAGVKARIFIDAPDVVRPGSGCPSGDGWGEIVANNDFFLNQGGNPADFQLFVVGWDPTSAYGVAQGKAYVDFKNKLNLDGLLFAPNAFVDFKNDAVINGGIGSLELDFKNNFHFNWDGDSAGWDDGSVNYSRQGWRECRPQPTSAGDPESGC
jgi:Tfp pilus assembly protein PilX